MKTFSNLKRDLRTLYKPKTNTKRLDEAQELNGDGAEVPCDDFGIQLALVSSTTAHSDITQKPRSPEPNGEPLEVAPVDAQAAIDDNEQDVSNDRRASRNSGALKTTDDSPLTVEEPANDDGGPVEEIGVKDQGLDSENTEILTFEEAQSLRDKVYTKFGTEEPEDFTDGTARFVESADGVKNCVALLITYDLSMKIQEALQGQHEFSRIELEGLFRRQSLLRLEDNVHREIFSCKARLCRLENEGQMDTEDGQKLEQQLTNLQLMLPDIQNRKQKTSVDVDMRAKQLRNLQAAVNARLEEAFVCARLVAPHVEEPEPEIEKLDVSQEYLGFCQRLEGPDDTVFEDAVLPLDNNRDYLKVPPPSKGEQARQEVVNGLWAAKEVLDLAHREFDNRENDRAREYQADVEAAGQGEATTDDSPEAFDVRWVMRFRELTRALIEAEAVYANVKRMAFEAGVPLPFTDNESVFEGVGDDTGYTMSKEQDLIASVPSPTVRNWLSKVPEGGETGSLGEETQFEAGEWDAEEVGINDSVSLVADGRQRSGIDRWQDACLAEKSQ